MFCTFAFAQTTTTLLVIFLKYRFESLERISVLPCGENDYNHRQLSISAEFELFSRSEN